MIRRMTEAKRQARLCHRGARWPEGGSGERDGGRLAGGAAGRVAAKPRPAAGRFVNSQTSLKIRLHVYSK